MSAIAATHEYRRKREGISAALARATVARVLAAAGLFVGVAGGALLATSGHLVHPVAYGIELAILVSATVWVALYWALRRPGNPIAVVLLAYAAAVAGISLQGASSPLLHSLGVLFDAPTFFLGYLAVFVFPEGRLAGRLEKALLAGVAGVLVVSFFPWFFFSPVVHGGAPLAGCNARCPSNALMIADNHSVARGFGRAAESLEALLAAAIVVGLCYRLATASRPRSRALVPVYASALLLTIPFGLFHVSRLQLGLVSISHESVNTIRWITTTGRLALTFGFLLAILQAMLFAGLALETLMSRLGPDEEPGHLRRLVADALDDPRLDLAFKVDHEDALFVDTHGHPVDPTDTAPGRSATPLRRHGETVAYILHDATLESDPELVQAAGQTILLALENGQLESELRSKTQDLQASRSRIVAAAEAERRKLERELHDGAQQRLLAIQVKLSLAEKRAAAGEDVSDDLAILGLDAAEAAAELRELAHGIYPTVLQERGLAEALRSLTTGSPVPIDIVDGGINRSSPTVEAAIYFCSLEAIQNAIKHAGLGARITVSLRPARGAIEFEIADDGVGMNRPATADGFGMVSMRDRIGAVGGELEIVSSPDAGTRVRGTVPAREPRSAISADL
jgi:signal transduction histidine kinase